MYEYFIFEPILGNHIAKPNKTIIGFIMGCALHLYIIKL